MTARIRGFGYAVVSATDLDAWESFATELTVDPQRDGPRGDQHDSADRYASAADVDTAGAHANDGANDGANADNCADETAAGVDFSP